MKKILVADDDNDFRVVLTHLLEREGYQVIAAPDGATALERIRAEKPDAVLLDIMMPNTHGFSVCHQIKSDKELQGIKVIVMSCKAFPADRRQAEQVGADLFLPKPFENQALLKHLKNIMGS